MGSLSRELQALETSRDVVAALAGSDERDDVIQRLIEAIEDDRAALLANVIGRRGDQRDPARISRPAGGSR